MCAYSVCWLHACCAGTDPTIIALLTKKKQRNLEAQVASALHQPNVTAPMEDGDTEAGGEEKMKTGELKEDGGTEAGDDEEKMKAGELMEDESASCQQPTPVKCETDSPADGTQYASTPSAVYLLLPV